MLQVLVGPLLFGAPLWTPEITRERKEPPRTCLSSPAPEAHTGRTSVAQKIVQARTDLPPIAVCSPNVHSHNRCHQAYCLVRGNGLRKGRDVEELEHSKAQETIGNGAFKNITTRQEHSLVTALTAEPTQLNFSSEEQFLLLSQAVDIKGESQVIQQVIAFKSILQVTGINNSSDRTIETCFPEPNNAVLMQGTTYLNLMFPERLHRVAI